MAARTARRAILQKYSNRATILLQQNAGQAAAFNHGFEKSSGDLILFLDSDDSLRSDAISTLFILAPFSFTKIQFPLEVIGPNGMPTGLSMPSSRLSEGSVIPDLLTIGDTSLRPPAGISTPDRFSNRSCPCLSRNGPRATTATSTRKPASQGQLEPYTVTSAFTGFMVKA